ncbi:MAG: translocation/assembly module TamB domain-containing protein [candidate division WOR-3 bacterium]|nr:MAG: translocation/assembly module TamB domain-containing protein [candidate division WOR-3 bacterium]
MKIKKRILLPLIFLAVIASGILIIEKTVDVGGLMISLLERAAHITVEYRSMKGGLFSGYRLEKYVVRLSETDSISGEVADIKYRFRPLTFRLPNLFEISFVEPTVYIKKKTGSGEERTEFRLPRLNMGLRVNLRNGRLVYDDETPLVLERISGLVFIDLIGSKIYLSTMNLSVSAPDIPLNITSANLEMRLSDELIQARSFRIKGTGFLLEGNGSFVFATETGTFTFTHARIVLDELGIHRGTIDFSGDIDVQNGMFLPRIIGTAYDIEPSERFNFETNVFADTIWANIFDARVWGGNLFAQVKFLNMDQWEFEANFNRLDLAQLFDAPEPMRIDGIIGYRDSRFMLHIHSLETRGPGFDSLMAYGTFDGSNIEVDSLFATYGEKILELSGPLFPNCNITMGFRNFDLTHLAQYIPVAGVINGSCTVQGDLMQPEDLAITTDLMCDSLIWQDIAIPYLSLSCDSFMIGHFSKRASVYMEHPSYKGITVGQLKATLDDVNFTLSAVQEENSLETHGTLAPDLTGSVLSLELLYNGTVTTNNTPLTFDINRREIGAFDLSSLGGILAGTISPLAVEMTDISLAEISKVFRLGEEISGKLDVTFADDVFSLNAENIMFMELENGQVSIDGIYRDNTLIVEHLDITDDRDQKCTASGTLSLERSDVTATFSNVGVWIFPFLKKSLIDPHGFMTGDVRFQGTIEDFQFSGGGEISHGSFGIKAISAQLDSLHGLVRFDKQHIFFESVTGRILSPGQTELAGADGAEVTAGGVVKLEPRFGSRNLRFDISFQDAPVQYLPFAYGIGSGNFSVGVEDNVPFYLGSITVKKAIVPIEFGMELEQEPTDEVSENYRANIRIKGERNIWLRNRDADIEFGGELYIVKEEGPLYLSGELQTARGNYYWLNHVLSITEGRVTFIPEEIIDAELDIWAEMQTRDRDPISNKPVTIRLHMFGMMTEPIFEFFTDPAGIYSEQDIITYLNLNMTWKELASMKEGELAGAALPYALVSWLESDVSRRIRRATGLDYFMIESRLFEPEEKIRLTVGKYISKDLFITYTSDMMTFSNEFNVEYFIDDKNEILIRRDEEGEFSLQYQYRIRF